MSLRRSIGNYLLAAFPEPALERLRPHFEAVELCADEVISEPGKPILASYFPTQGLVSLVRTMANGRSVEIGAFGVEGVTGLDALFGDKALLECIVRVPGRALRLPTEVLRSEIAADPAVRAVAARFILAVFNQIAQTAACNRLHRLEKRCCRWLLITDDNCGAPVIPATHEFLAKLLGVQRAAVTVKLQGLERRGLIRLGRGAISIVDRPTLEANACECYGLIRAHADANFRLDRFD